MDMYVSYDVGKFELLYQGTGVVALTTGSVNPATFSSMALGGAHPTRRVVAAIAVANTSAVASVTIAGIAATQIAAPAPYFGTVCAMWMAHVPTGTTGDVVVSTGSGISSAVVDTFALYNMINTTATDTATDTASPVTTTVDVMGSGIILAIAAVNDAALTGAVAWSGGVTQITNTLSDIGGGNGMRLTTARYDATSAATISPSMSVTNATEAGATASFR